ncbi:hypothetical protein PRNP1_013702 [Phytophthora ramorum]
MVSAALASSGSLVGSLVADPLPLAVELVSRSDSVALDVVVEVVPEAPAVPDPELLEVPVPSLVVLASSPPLLVTPTMMPTATPMTTSTPTMMRTLRAATIVL